MADEFVQRETVLRAQEQFHARSVAGKGMVAQADNAQRLADDVMWVEGDLAAVDEDALEQIHAATPQSGDAIGDGGRLAGAFDRQIYSAAIRLGTDDFSVLLGRMLRDVECEIGAETPR